VIFPTGHPDFQIHGNLAMNNDALNQHAFLWTTPGDRYVLLKLPPGGEGGLLDFAIYDREDKGVIVIENDCVYAEVVQTMIDRGATILTNISKD
jgi:hypothetical protein